MAEQTPPQKKRPQPQKRPAQARPAQAAKSTAAKSAAAKTRNTQQNSDEVSPLATVITRNDFYRDQYRGLVKIAVFEGIAIILLIISMIVLINVHQPKNLYFATTSDGRPVPMVPLSQPNLSKPALLSWATQAATEVMTFGFNDYRRRLQEASRHFTREGWLSFTEALKNADIIEAVENNRQAITAAPRSAPVLISEGINKNGRFQWEIQIPMNITTSSGAGQKSDSWNVKLTIVRVPVLESPNGVGIQQWLAMGG
jgi:intracellular multiplication protein IcmL